MQKNVQKIIAPFIKGQLNNCLKLIGERSQSLKTCFYSVHYYAYNMIMTILIVKYIDHKSGAENDLSYGDNNFTLLNQ